MQQGEISITTHIFSCFPFSDLYISGTDYPYKKKTILNIIHTNCSKGDQSLWGCVYRCCCGGDKINPAHNMDVSENIWRKMLIRLNNNNAFFIIIHVILPWCHTMVPHPKTSVHVEMLNSTYFLEISENKIKKKLRHASCVNSHKS